MTEMPGMVSLLLRPGFQQAQKVRTQVRVKMQKKSLSSRKKMTFHSG